MGKISFIGMVFGLLFLGLSNAFAATIHVPADQPTINKTFSLDTLFNTKVDYSVGLNPIGICLKDIDKDGDLDLAVANRGTGLVSILKNKGNGVFLPNTNYGVGYASSVTLADFDKDGDNDMAVTNNGESHISILKNNGSGQYSTAVNYLTASSPYAVCSADLDGDGDIDLVVAAEGNAISILKNKGDGTFTAPYNYSIGSSDIIAITDIDNDGDEDLLIPGGGFNYVSVKKNDGDGNFPSATHYAVGMIPRSVCADDFDSDGDKDLAVANFGSNNVSILLNDGGGLFSASTNYDAGNGPISVASGDINDDGYIDLAIANNGSNDVSILLNNGDGTFAAPVNYGAGSLPIFLSLGDFDHDKDIDIAVSNNGSKDISILINMTKAPTPRSLRVPSEYNTIQSAIDSASFGDTVLVADGIYTGIGNRDMDFYGKYIIVISANGSEVTTIKCEGTQVNHHWAFWFHTGEDSTSVLDGFTITEGTGKSWGPYCGGAITIDSCSPSIRNCVFKGNLADYGGAIYADDSYLQIHNCLFLDNHANEYGGAIRFMSDVLSTHAIVRNCTFVDNYASQYGSAVHSHNDTVEISNSIFSFNKGSEVISGNLWEQQKTIISCTDLYGNEYGDWAGATSWLSGMYGNILQDPLFCDTGAQNYFISVLSPCAPQNNECNIIMGANGINCGIFISGFRIDNEEYLHVKDHEPDFDWASVNYDSGFQDSFLIAIGTDSDWATAEMWNPAPVASADTVVTYAGAPLVDGATYYLRLRVHNGVVWSNWYQTSFRMNSIPTIPVLTWPDSGAIINTTTPTLYVHNSIDAENDTRSYDYEVVNDSAFGDLILTSDSNITQMSDSTGWVVNPSLMENWKYWWRSRAFDQFEKSNWSTIQSFWVNAVEEPPGLFNINPLPETTGTVFQMLPQFHWLASSDPDPLDSVHYTLYIALDSNFLYLRTIENIQSNSYQLADSLLFATRYWWKVKATDKTGRYTYSANTLSFRTWKLGDANGDWLVNIQDVTFIINFLYKTHVPPRPLYVGDINGNCRINIQDISYLISYLHKNGPPPKIGCM